jgi:hypothetical protein
MSIYSRFPVGHRKLHFTSALSLNNQSQSREKAQAHKFISRHKKNRPREQRLYSAQNDKYNQSNITKHGTSDADPDPLVRCTDVDHAPDPDPSIIKKKL